MDFDWRQVPTASSVIQDAFRVVGGPRDDSDAKGHLAFSAKV